MQRFVLMLMLTTLASTACARGGYRRATVVEMAYIFEPDNLSTDAECRTLWRDIARFGIEMDEARDDWNQVILNNATQLIERGCVRRIRPR